jgi:ATP-dependent DNA helicase RecG
VAQRALLPKKSSNNPHYLVMSATPIPRSLALSLYGDLDISVINQMPLGRTPSRNLWMKEKQRKQVYEMIRQRIKEGKQVYIVYPLIEETEDEDLKSLEEMFERVSKEFSDYKTGMFHGRIKSAQKLKVIEEFKANKIQILVSTTVVEVGVSIANATMMVVENPERFGLAQLHQLRGRIQRSSNPSDFILLSPDELNEVAIRRIQTIISTSDGFKIAEEDLLARGPGDFFGAMQHGLPFLRIANPLRDLEILKDARLAAFGVVKDDPYLEKPQNKCVRENIDFGLINSVKVDNKEVIQELK